MAPGALFPGFGQLPGGSAEVACEGMFGALFRPDGRKDPFSQVSASSPAARQKWPLTACLEHFFAQMARRVPFSRFRQAAWGLGRSGP